MPHPRRLGIWFAVAIAVAAAAFAGYAWWRNQPRGPAPRVAAQVQSPDLRASAAGAASAPAAAAPAALPPGLPAPVVPAAAASLAEPGLRELLVELLGTQAVLNFMQTHDFAHRFAVTVDNLGREHAAPLLWPVSPTPGRFTVAAASDGQAIGADNAARYRPFVELAQGFDIGRTVAFYVRLRPEFQQAYENLGYPKRSFDARLLEVIDLLLATPRVAPPVKVKLTEVKGPIPSTWPWVRYEFADPDLEALPAGQKMLVRMGEDNAARLKVRLQALRAELIRQGVRG